MSVGLADDATLYTSPNEGLGSPLLSLNGPAIIFLRVSLHRYPQPIRFRHRSTRPRPRENRSPSHGNGLNAVFCLGISYLPQ